MINFIYKFKFLLAILIVILYSINPAIALLCFCFLFQIGSIVEIINQIKLSKKVKSGKYIVGNLTEVRNILGSENEVHNYEGTIEFYFPDKGNKYLLKHKFSSLSKPNISKEYKIWVDEKNPNSSIVFDYFNHYWKFSATILFLITIVLFIADFLLLKKYNYSKIKNIGSFALVFGLVNHTFLITQ